MSVLENLRNLPKENIQKNLNVFKIRSTGNLENDIHNLNNFYFENIETLYNHLPMCTYEFLENTLKKDSEKVFNEDFQSMWSTYEELGLVNQSISKHEEDVIKFVNKYSKDNNLENLPKEKFEEIIDEAVKENRFTSDEESQMMYFESFNKEIGTVLFEFLEKNPKLREKESYILKLINGIVEIHGSLDVDETFKVLKKLEIDLSYEQTKRFIISKVPDTLFDYNDIVIVHDRDIKDHFHGVFKKSKVKDIHPLETYLNIDFRI